MTLLCLPVEVLAQVIERLELKSMVRCRQVCQMFRKLVDSTVSIQYAIELCASGVLDNRCPPPEGSVTTQSTAQRLATLRRLNIAWKDLRLPSHSIIIHNQNWSTTYELSGGLFIQDVNEDQFAGQEVGSQSTLSFMELPSSSRGIVGVGDDEGEGGEEPSLMTREFDFRVADLCLDVERDLIVLVERKDTETILPDGEISYTITCILHLFSLSSFAHHPDASQPTISVSFISATSDYMMVTQVGGDHLALLLPTRHSWLTGTDRFFLCDWTNGVRKDSDTVYDAAVISQWDTVCFISHDVLLLPDTTGSVLNIYTFTDEPRSLVRAASLSLPRQTELATLVSITARSEPAPRSPHLRRLSSSHPSTQSTHQRRPFTTDPDSAIVVLTLQYMTEENPIEPEETVIVHRSTLLELARRGLSSAPSRPKHVHTGTALEWEDWGPSCSRWGLGASPPRWVCYTYGQRFVSMDPAPLRRVDEDGQLSRPLIRITVYDFNMMNAERDVPIENSPVDVSLQMRRSSLPQSPTRSEYPCIISNPLHADEGLSQANRGVENPEVDSGDVGGMCISPGVSFGGHLSAVQNITTESVTSRSRIFKNDIVSSLPYRVVTTHEMFEWDSVMIDDERIIGLKEMPDGYGLDSLEVLVM